MIFIYRFFTIIFYPIIIVFIYIRTLLGKEDICRYKEKIFPCSTLSSRNNIKRLIWFHAASIGEAKSIFPIIYELKKNKDLEFLITTITLSAGNLIKKKFDKDTKVTHRYFPIDINFLIKRFLNFWKPNLIIFVDSEIWPNLIFEINKRNIPSAIVNGRITHKSFKRWMVVSNFARKIFSTFKLCLASSEKSKNYLEKLGANNLKYIGNIKLSENINDNESLDVNKEILKKRNFWCAASTHKGEETFCLKTHINLKKDIKNLITFIIPRHIHRSGKIKSLCEQYNLSAQILNNNENIKSQKEIIIINSFGVLSKYFKYSKSVFIGKSISRKLQNEGGQNPIEAAKYNCKIYHGPYVDNFKEIYELLKSYKISCEINNENELSEKLKFDFKSPKNNNNTASIINDLGNKILNDSIEEINKILK